MYQIIDGKELAKKIREQLRVESDELKKKGITAKLAVILVGDNAASKVYIKNKSKACEDVGVEFEEIILDNTTKMEKLLSIIDELNARKDINGILLQSPIPEGLNIQEAFERIDYRKDVDGFNSINAGKLMIGQDCFVSCTPYGVIKMLENYNIPIEGKHAVVIGRSNIVGKPVATLMMQKAYPGDATVTVCHSGTKNITEICRQADIIIAAIGKPGFVTADMVKDGAVVIDVGTTRVPSTLTKSGFKLRGDVDFEAVSQKCSYITPVPGGVGPMTIVSLMQNTLLAAKKELY